MAAADLCDLGIAELGRRYRARELSPVDVTTAHLARIERLDKTLNSYVTVTAEHALADARAAEAAIRRGDAGPLAGIPIAYKDLYATRGILTTGGSALLADWVPDHDATCVTRLAAGGHGDAGQAHHPRVRLRHPVPRAPVPAGAQSVEPRSHPRRLHRAARARRWRPASPWAPSDRTPAARSAGPAAFCGIVGLKPTYGRVSRAGVLTLSWTLDHTGPMARSVEDCALHAPGAGRAMIRPIPRRAASRCPTTPAGLRRGVRGLRIGVPRDYFFERREAGGGGRVRVGAARPCGGSAPTCAT